MSVTTSDPNSNPVTRQSAFSRTVHSIRTRYSLATAAFLLIILGLFYIGGRIVLVHLVRDAEAQVQGIGLDIRRLAYHNAELLQRVTTEDVGLYAAHHGSAPRLESLLRPRGTPPIVLSFRLDAEGGLVEAWGLGPDNRPIQLDPPDFAGYLEAFPAWTRDHLDVQNQNASIGIIRIHGVSYYIAIAGYGHPRHEGYLVLGTPFDSGTFMSQVNENLAGMEIRVTNRRAEVPAAHAVATTSTDRHAPPVKRPSIGIVPIFSEAINFYSGGFWELGSNPFEAVFTMRDIAGNAVSMISVSLPRTFSNVTSVAISRLTFFIAVVGILLILPVFWLQSRILLNPLTEISRRIRAVGEHHADTDCPRLDWRGKDEFAQLASSVNAMLETISRRSVAIAQVESRQRALIDGLPDALAIFDRAHNLVSVSKEPDGFEPVPGLLSGHPLDHAVFPAQAAAAFEAALDKAFETDAITSLNLPTTAVEGKPARHFEVRLSRMDDHFALAILRDVTAEAAEHASRIAAETRLARAQKQESLGVLAAGIAHDVNNVLAVVLNTAEITWMDSKDPDVVSALSTIRDAVKRGSAMARELMTVAGETKIVFKRSDPSDIVREAQRLAQGIVPQTVTITYDLPPGLPAVDVDPSQIWKVFFNLIKNAAEAMEGRPGEIHVSTRKFTMTPDICNEFYSTNPLPPGPGVLFQLADNGSGIPPEVIKRVFDPFFSTKSVGRGLGLATVLAIVDAHNGGIAVNSEVDKGTTFRIFLPVSKLVGEITRRLQVLTTSGNVLLVDNDPAILRTTSILLKTLHVAVTTATNNRDALDAFRRLAPTLTCVLLDAHLGEFDTVRLLGSFRTTSPSVPIVISSGSSIEKVKAMFASRPYDGFLAKPYTLAELQDALARFSRKIEAPDE